MMGRLISASAVVIAALILVAGSASAQMSEEAELQELSSEFNQGLRPAESPFSLLDISRIKWSHSYSVSFFSGGGYSGSAGLFQTSAVYDISSDLTLGVNLGIAHSGFLLSEQSQDATFLPGFTLDYHPSDKFRMTLMIQTYNGLTSPYYRNRSGLFGRPLLGP
jgi:hypothetical protein